MKKKELANADAAQSFVDTALAVESARARCPSHGIRYSKDMDCTA